MAAWKVFPCCMMYLPPADSVWWEGELWGAPAAVKHYESIQSVRAAASNISICYSVHS